MSIGRDAVLQAGKVWSTDIRRIWQNESRFSGKRVPSMTMNRTIFINVDFRSENKQFQFESVHSLVGLFAYSWLDYCIFDKGKTIFLFKRNAHFSYIVRRTKEAGKKKFGLFFFNFGKYNITVSTACKEELYTIVIWILFSLSIWPPPPPFFFWLFLWYMA